MKSKLAKDLDRFRQATEKVVGRERQKYVQGTGRLMQEREYHPVPIEGDTVMNDMGLIGDIVERQGDMIVVQWRMGAGADDYHISRFKPVGSPYPSGRGAGALQDWRLD